MTRKHKVFVALIVVILSAIACTLTEAPTNPPTQSAPTETARAPTAPPPTVTEVYITEQCVVTTQALHLRKGPGENNKIVEYLRAGDVIKPEKNHIGAWLAVMTKSGNFGYVNSSFIKCERKP